LLQLNKIYNQDCKEGMKLLPDNSISSIVTDPPYGLSKEPNIVEVLTNWLNNEEYIHNSKGFMNVAWDSFVPNPSIWKEAYRVLKPGGYLLCFAGTRTYDLMCISLRLAVFEIRDQIDWIYSTGFPKSMNISKEMEKRRCKVNIGEWILKRMELLNLDKKDVAKHCNVTPRQIDHWIGINTPCPQNPNEKRYLLLEEILQDKPYFREQFISKKGKKIGEIVHQRSGGNDFAKIVGSQSNSKTEELFDLATEEAKQWSGYGTSLKPAHEPIIVARKPLSEKTIVDNVLKWNTGGINIDDCRVEYQSEEDLKIVKAKCNFTENSKSIGFGTSDTLYGTGSTPLNQARECVNNEGRFPANIIMDEEAGKILDLQSGITKSGKVKENKDAYKGESNTGFLRGKSTLQNQHGDTGGASRYFLNILYCEDDYICGNIIENLKVVGTLNGVIQEIEKFIQNVEQDIYGNKTMEKFLLDLKCIILIVTNLTIELKIWNYYQNINIINYMEMQEKIIKLLMELNIENVNTVENIKILMNFIKEMNVIKDIVKIVQEKNYENGDISTKNLIINITENIKEKKGNYINFMYCAKASKKERGEGNNHPCVKPLSLIKYLVTLVTPPNGICLDPFEGSGTTFLACRESGFDHIGFEMNKDYCDIAEKRLNNKNT